MSFLPSTSALRNSTLNMVLSTSPSAPVVIVTGITGRQGGSFARALIASTRPYRIIGITRDPTRPSAKEWLDLGVELRQADIAVGNEAAVVEALNGGQIVFVRPRCTRTYYCLT